MFGTLQGWSLLNVKHPKPTKKCYANCLYGTPCLPLFALPCHAYDTHATGSMVHLQHMFAKDRVEMFFLDYPLRK